MSDAATRAEVDVALTGHSWWRGGYVIIIVIIVVIIIVISFIFSF